MQKARRESELAQHLVTRMKAYRERERRRRKQVRMMITCGPFVHGCNEMKRCCLWPNSIEIASTKKVHIIS